MSDRVQNRAIGLDHDGSTATSHVRTLSTALSCDLTEKRVFMAFNSPRGQYLESIALGQLPESFAYGFARFRKHGVELCQSDVRDGGEWSKKAGRITNLVASKLLGAGFNLSRSIRLLPELRQMDLVFTTVDSAGLPILLLRQLGLLRTPIIYQTVGLMERFRPERKRSVRRRFLRGLMNQAAHFVCYTQAERDWLTDFGGVPSTKVLCLNSIAGVDTEFFGRVPTSDDEFVLTVGRDSHRDFATLFKAAERCPNIEFVVVAGKSNLRGLDNPPNVKVFIELSFPDLLELYRTARLIAMPLVNNSYSPGGVVLGETMSMGKPVVLSRVDALRGMRPLESSECCVLVEPENTDQLYEAIVMLYSDKAMRDELGQRAKAVARQCFDIDFYVGRLTELFARVCKEESGQ